MDLGLDGKVALVTGARRGIGAAIATALAREGCHVAALDATRDEDLDRVVESVGALGRRALALQVDVRDFTSAERAVRSTVDTLGGLDVLVCNAGITRDGVSWKMPEEAWDDVIDVNLKGCFACARAAGRHFREAGKGGRIVSITSINGLRGKFGQANYAASKAGLIGLTKTLARELGPKGVTVNAVAPGLVDTEMTRLLPPEALEAARRETVMGRAAQPEDVARLVVFLASEAAGHITGEVIRVDGGQYI